MERFVIYTRVSTKSQSKSGLELYIQKNTHEDLLGIVLRV